jgi:arsenate reductase (thioredoxin)
MAKIALFICTHGAGRSRVAAAFFNRVDPPGWVAHSAGVAPQDILGANAERMLAGSNAEAFLDHSPPRPISAVPSPELVITIDCAVPFPGAERWDLVSQRFDEEMCSALRERAELLARKLADA